MIELILPFVAALMLILLAQLGEQRSWARWTTYILLLFSGLIVGMAGVFTLVAPDLVATSGKIDNVGGLAWALLVTGLVIAVPVAAGMVLSARNRDATIRGIPWTRPVHLTDWTLLAAFIGSNFAVAAVKPLTELEIEQPLSLLIVQNSGFALAAVLGVGLGFRRGWRQTLARLGFTRPSIHDFLMGLGMALVMLMTTGIVGALVAFIFGMDTDASSGINQQLIQQLPGVGGVLIMGLTTGIGEEMLYRGALQPVAGLWLTSLLFAVSHIQYLSPYILIIFLLGVLLGYTRKKWGLNTSIWAHALYNTLVGLIALLALNFV